MRTTLDIDDRVLSVARSRANAYEISIGRALSELAQLGIEAQKSEAQKVAAENGSGFTLPSVPGHVITPEMVAEHRDD